MTRRREPTGPGEILRKEFLIPLGLTQKQVADHLGCDVKVVNRIVNGRTSVTAEMALKLGAAFQTTPEFWLNAQKAVDLYRAARRVEELPRPLLKVSRPGRVAGLLSHLAGDRPVTVEEMDEGIREHARRKYDKAVRR
jgi:addiction module HigA family antidote